jgi:hypothetical protein
MYCVKISYIFRSYRTIIKLFFESKNLNITHTHTHTHTHTYIYIYIYIYIYRKISNISVAIVNYIYGLASKCSPNNFISEIYKTLPSFKLHFLPSSPLMQLCLVYHGTSSLYTEQLKTKQVKKSARRA